LEAAAVPLPPAGCSSLLLHGHGYGAASRDSFERKFYVCFRTLFRRPKFTDLMICFSFRRPADSRSILRRPLRRIAEKIRGATGGDVLAGRLDDLLKELTSSTQDERVLFPRRMR
jgi:hypothetical protein